MTEGKPLWLQGAEGVGNQSFFPKTSGCHKLANPIDAVDADATGGGGGGDAAAPQRRDHFLWLGNTGTPPSDSLWACGPFMYR